MPLPLLNNQKRFEKTKPPHVLVFAQSQECVESGEPVELTRYEKPIAVISYDGFAADICGKLLGTSEAQGKKRRIAAPGLPRPPSQTEWCSLSGTPSTLRWQKNARSCGWKTGFRSKHGKSLYEKNTLPYLSIFSIASFSFEPFVFSRSSGKPICRKISFFFKSRSACFVPFLW